MEMAGSLKGRAVRCFAGDYQLSLGSLCGYILDGGLLICFAIGAAPIKPLKLKRRTLFGLTILPHLFLSEKQMKLSDLAPLLPLHSADKQC
jgi:hypothetical protein